MAATALTPKQVIRRYLKAMTHGKPVDLTKLVAPNVLALQGAERVQGAEAATPPLAARRLKASLAV